LAKTAAAIPTKKRILNVMMTLQLADQHAELSAVTEGKSVMNTSGIRNQCTEAATIRSRVEIHRRKQSVQRHRGGVDAIRCGENTSRAGAIFHEAPAQARKVDISEVNLVGRRQEVADCIAVYRRCEVRESR
jgi:hypothetical protein